MRILQVTPRYAPNTGGVENHVQAISERMVELGHDVTVLTADGDRTVTPRETIKGVTVRRHRAFAPKGNVHVAPGITQSIRRESADVVHAHNIHSLPVLFAAAGVKDERFVVTAHYHGGSASSRRDKLLSLYRPLARWALAQADELISVSEWEAARLGSDFGVSATVIPNGLDIQKYQQATPEERDRPYLLSVGRLEPYKGIQDVIRSLPRIPVYDLLIAGTGPYRDELEQHAIAAGVEDRVGFLGYVDEDRLVCLYAGAEAFVTLSRYEAYGMTVAEALTAGTPCVVLETGALAEWVDKQGVVGIAEVSPDAVARAIDRAVTTAVEVEIPSWKDIADTLEQVYARL